MKYSANLQKEKLTLIPSAVAHCSLTVRSVAWRAILKYFAPFNERRNEDDTISQKTDSKNVCFLNVPN